LDLFDVEDTVVVQIVQVKADDGKETGIGSVGVKGAEVDGLARSDDWAVPVASVEGPESRKRTRTPGQRHR
jgi:hypothetical protein